MPQIRAVLSIFAVLAFCIGFNIHRYPAVSEMVAGMSKSNAEAKPPKSATTEPKLAEGPFKKDEPAKEKEKPQSPPKNAVKKDPPKKDEKKAPPIRRAAADPIPLTEPIPAAEPVRPTEPKEEKSETPAPNTEAAPEKPAQPETVQTRPLVPVGQLPPAADATKAEPPRTDTFQRFPPWSGSGGRVEVKSFHRFPPVETLQLSQAKPSTIPAGTIPFYPTTK